MSLSWVVPDYGMVTLPNDTYGDFVPSHGMVNPTYTGLIAPESMALPYWGDLTVLPADIIIQSPPMIEFPQFGRFRIFLEPLSNFGGLYPVTFGTPTLSHTGSPRTIYPEGFLVPTFGTPSGRPDAIVGQVWVVPNFGIPDVHLVPKVALWEQQGTGGWIWLGTDHKAISQIQKWQLTWEREEYDVSEVGNDWRKIKGKDIRWSLTAYLFFDMSDPGQEYIFNDIINEGTTAWVESISIRAGKEYIFEQPGMIKSVKSSTSKDSVLEVELVILGSGLPVLSTTVRKELRVTQMVLQIEFEGDPMMMVAQMALQVEFSN